MRIRKRLALSSIPSTAAFSDLQLQPSEAAPPSYQPSDRSMPIHSGWIYPKNEEKMKQKEFGDEILRLEANDSSNYDIRKIVNICGGGQDFTTSLQPSSSSVQESCYEENYEVVPLKKRKGRFERNPNEESSSINAKMKSKTNNKYGEIDHHQKPEREQKKSKRGSVVMEGSRCSRVNGRGWRCCQPTLVGYSLCEHHLGKGRLRSVANVRRGARQSNGGGAEEEEPLMMMKRKKVGVVKARSMSSLLSQTQI